MATQQVTLYALDRERAEQTVPELARELSATIGPPDDAGMVEVEVEAESHEAALARVRDAIAATGAEERFTFPETTGTGFNPPGHRAPPPDEEPDDSDEPPHLERGSPH